MLVKNRLICLTFECGFYIVKLGTIKKLTDVPCLAHVINVLVQKLIATGETGEVSGTVSSDTVSDTDGGYDHRLSIMRVIVEHSVFQI